MPLSARRGILFLALALVSTVLAAVAAPATAEAATGRVRIAVYGSQPGIPSVRVRIFTRDWAYLGEKKVSGGVYSARLAPGTYWLQFVDRRPAYDVSKYAPEDVRITVRTGRTATRHVTMRRGAAITGRVSAGGRPAAGARMVAANQYQQSYEVRANGRGEFALGGLPTGKYSLFTYERTRTWVGRSLWVGKLVRGRVRDTRPRVNTRAGRLVVDLYAGGQPLLGKFWVTATNRRTGQWWTAKARGGTVVLAGVHPGRYTLRVPDVGQWFGRTGRVQQGRVRSGKVGFGSFRLQRNGASVSGRVVDGHSGAPLAGVQVTLRNSAGSTIGGATTGADGVFVVVGRLTSQSGVTVLASLGNEYRGGCLYDPARSQAFALTTGVRTSVGTIRLPRRESTGEQCPPEPTPGQTP